MRLVLVLSFLFWLISCQHQQPTGSKIQIVGAMKNVMWKGELDGIINLDTIQERGGLYGIGPLEGLRGELLISNGKSYVSTVAADSSMQVQKDFRVAAPFFVYANVKDWEEIELPAEVFDLQRLQQYLYDLNWRNNEPYVFILTGTIESATIHIQHLAPGSVVTSPQEAHQGQVNYDLAVDSVEMIGFFSTTHQGVFVHHDAYTHIHLITTDERKMGHLDAVQLVGSEMQLFLAR